MTNQNSNLTRARKQKNDEFYTSLADVNAELVNYEAHLKDKVIYCNCDDPAWSQFYNFFKLEFQRLSLKKLITTHYVQNGTSYKREYDGAEEVDTPLEGDGDFRSDECKAILNEVDIVITNPPFSLFREFVNLLIEKEKQFLVLGNNNAITYKEIFKFIKENKLWLGTNNNKTLEFRIDPSYTKWSRIDDQGNKYGKVPAISWFTNLLHSRRNQDIFLFKEYSTLHYPKYDNCDIIEVSKVVNIPKDYYEPMGVPITFLDKYCPQQFEILGIANNVRSIGFDCRTIIDSKPVYNRIIIRRRSTPNAN